MASELAKGLEYLTVLGPGKVIVLLSTMPGDKLTYLSRNIEHKKILSVLRHSSVRTVAAIEPWDGDEVRSTTDNAVVFVERVVRHEIEAARTQRWAR